MSHFLKLTQDASDQAESDTNDKVVSRRNFLQKALVGGSAAAAVSMLPAFAIAKSKSSLSKKDSADVFQSILQHEKDHVNFLVSALGAAARPKPNFAGLDQKNYDDFVLLAKTFENVGVGAYLGAAPAIENPAYLAAAGSIATIEARHAGVLNILLDEPVSLNNASFDIPLSAGEVIAAVSPFLVDLNGGLELTYSTTRSAANDIVILNFALALEYLEAEFYQLNEGLFSGKKQKKHNKDHLKN